MRTNKNIRKAKVPNKNQFKTISTSCNLNIICNTINWKLSLSERSIRACRSWSRRVSPVTRSVPQLLAGLSCRSTRRAFLTSPACFNANHTNTSLRSCQGRCYVPAKEEHHHVVDTVEIENLLLAAWLLTSWAAWLLTSFEFVQFSDLQF